MELTSAVISSRVKTIGAVFLVICCCFSYAKGSCLSYGHSCWGGHGKRSGPPSGRSMAQSIQAPPLISSDLWPAIERMKPPGGKGPLPIASNNIYYQPLGRIFKVPPASTMDLVDADPSSASSSDENDENSSRPDDYERNGDSILENHTALRSQADQLRQRQLRRKASRFETATAAETGSSNEDDIGQLLLDPAASKRNNQILFKLLSAPPPQKFDHGT